MTEFVDTTIFIRLLTGDDPEKAARCLELFLRAQQGEVQLATSEPVVAEIVCVLSSRATYRLLRTRAATVLRPILANPGLTIDHKGSILLALDLWEQSNLDFEDCLSVEHVRRADLTTIYSYDRDFDLIPDTRRLEP